MIADAAGRAVAFVLAPGQSHELPLAVPLLEKLPGVPKWVVADRGYSSHAFREHIWDLGSRPVIPTRKTEETLSCPAWVYTNRNQVERLWSRLKEWRAFATRYEDCRLFHGRALPRRSYQLDQELTGPSLADGAENAAGWRFGNAAVALHPAIPTIA